MCGRYTLSEVYGNIAKRFQLGLWEPIEERVLSPFVTTRSAPSSHV